VIGKSLGTGIATALAIRRCIEKLILVTPYDTLTNVAADYLPLLPVRWLLRDGYDSVHRITQVRSPVLVVLAEKDGLVLKPRSDALIAAIPAALRHVRVIKDARHTNIRRYSDYPQSLKEFAAS
jgi:pimeloyl-ACP methyl ester carboxylesterase